MILIVLFDELLYILQVKNIMARNINSQLNLTSSVTGAFRLNNQ